MRPLGRSKKTWSKVVEEDTGTAERNFKWGG